MLSNPIVTASNMAALPSDKIGTVTTDASNSPPPGGNGPVSAKVVVTALGVPGRMVTDAPMASPLKVVVDVDVSVVDPPPQAEARGIAVYTKSATTVIPTRSINMLENFATFATAALETMFRCHDS